MPVFKYINVSSGNLVGGGVTLAPTQESTGLSANAGFDLLNGFGIERYVDQQRSIRYQELSTVTGTEIPVFGIGSQTLVTTTAALACSIANGAKMTVTMANAFTHANPTNIPPAGTEVVYYVNRTGDVGSFAITWSGLHKGAWSVVVGTAGQKCILWGESDGTNLVFAAFSGWY